MARCPASRLCSWGLVLPLSPKQRILAGWGATPGEGRKVIAGIGASRSGKTHSASLGFFLYTQSLGPLPADMSHLVIGQSFSVMRATIWEHLTSYAPNYTWQGTDRLLTINGCKYRFLAYANVQSETRPMGFTIHSLLSDESTLIGERFFTLALGRATSPQSRVWVLANPSAPGHFLKRKFIDAGKFDAVLHFTFEDNPSLAESVKADLRALYVGADYSRLVDGVWAAQAGSIYPSFTAVDEPPNATVTELDVAIDVGYKDPYVALFIGKTRKGNYLLLDEYWWESAEHGERSAAEHARAVTARAVELRRLWGARPGAWLIDPAAAADVLQYRRLKHWLPSVVKDILPGISNLRVQLEKPRYYILRTCEHLLRELEGYVWLDNKTKDTPSPYDDHSLDALRYHAAHRFPLDEIARYL